MAILLALVSAAAPAVAESTEGVIVGVVEAPDGSRVEDARVVLVELNRSTFVDEQGAFRFEQVPEGFYHLQVTSRRFGTTVGELEVVAGDNPIVIEMGRSSHHEQIVVTSTRGGHGSAELVQPVDVLDEDQLVVKLGPTIGETLAQQPGVSQSYFGAGSSRPIIRGQGGGRVRVLEGGIGVGDASTTSPDHAVATDPMQAGRIEIVRGPATLFYGGSAVGGVVNILDHRIPDYAPQSPFSGELQLRGGSVADQRAAGVKIDGGGGKFAWHLDAAAMESDDYDIPGNAVEGDPSSPAGTLPNSGIETDSATFGASWIAKSGFVGASVRRFESLYGIPADLEAASRIAETLAASRIGADGLAIDMEQTRYDVRGGFDRKFGPFTNINFAAGFNDYQHTELEQGDPGTEFFVDQVEGRVELDHAGSGPIHGGIGLQFSTRDIEAVGAEAFIPPSQEDLLGIFAVEEVHSGNVRYEMGLRFETVDASTAATIAANPICIDPRGRSFDPISGAFGLAWLPGESFAFGLSVTRGARAPNAEELYSCGEHVATASFEVGDPGLDEETSLGLDLSFRKRAGTLTGSINLFTSRYDDYIFERPTGEIEPPGGAGLPVFRFTQDDSEFYGFEVDGLVELYQAGDKGVGLHLVGEYVRAETDDGAPLPFIPPLSLGAGVIYEGATWRASADVRWYDDQDRVPATVTPTRGYTMVDALVGYRIIGSGVMHEILLRGSNLLDEDARLATSRLKDVVPLPGTNVSAVYRLIF